MQDDDRQLLRRYAETGAEEAFCELVRRHLDLVYSTALRGVAGETALAEDVTQTVFADLARKAPTLVAEVVVGGWLYQAARFTSAKAVRGEQRRRLREAAAGEAHMNPPEPEPDWNRIRPLLDAAMDDLPATDRDAVVLRFFQRRELRDVGAALGLSDEAARKRVSRALDRLRRFLGRRGITTTSGALATAISAHAVTSAPAGLVATITTVSLAAGTTASGTTLFLKLLPALAMTKTQTALVTAVLLAGVATPLAIQQHHETSQLRASLQALQDRLADASAALPAENLRSARPLAEPARADNQAELMRLRGEVARLRAQAASVPPPRPPGRSRAHFRPETPLSAQAGYVPATQMQFSGLATPEAALQSYLWAAEHPDSGKLLGTLALPDEFRAKLPEDSRNVAVGIGMPLATEYGAPATVADVLNPAGTGQGQGQTQGYRIVGETDLAADLKQVEVQREQPDGSVVSETHTLKKVGDEWKVQPGTPVQIAFETGDGSQVFFNSAPSQGDDGSVRIGQTVSIRNTAPGSPLALPTAGQENSVENPTVSAPAKP
ncbi:MAG TPA: sigma-70 family RNA polymerase sigma factor [Candidatus Limnocylindria bacterium]|nr:sigma-70 family RNA polymerase sigma factor [Candidatus Limnocylindria bacterium]